jgi:hypothetical protein
MGDAVARRVADAWGAPGNECDFVVGGVHDVSGRAVSRSGQEDGRRMTPELADDLRLLIDRDGPAAAGSVDVSAAFTPEQVQFQLRKFFAAPGAPAAVELVHGAERIGPVTERSLRRSERNAAEPSSSYEAGGGERLLLGGVSARYRLLTFSCQRCHAEAHRIYYDGRNLPTCRHGTMRLRR